ncbi:Hexapeptide repeat of succinyl-transferase [Auraticoccus monumenti]|uniref:Hexapeptide repeat of succinyl-transferase n=1 Tax=Auraticoccus monumenti TaxID=675864 RepID=A0A1G7F3Y5_9ACTN|nr:Hexapeptide repeat of succinyl-transferase [Auraticoccus monumenti]
MIVSALSKVLPVRVMRPAVRALSDRLQIRADPVRWARGLGVAVGDRCRFLAVSRATFGSEPYLIRIGNHVTITEGVRFVTHDGGVWIFRDDEPQMDVVAGIVVEDNVFIGLRAILLPGVHVGRNSVVAAGAVVSRDVPAGSVVGGVPARRLKSVEEYRASLHGRAQPTKGMSFEEKRSWHLAHLSTD